MPIGEPHAVFWLDLRLAETLCHAIAERLSDDRNEPMPAFKLVNLARLEASLEAPRQAFGIHEPYPGLEEKAAALLYFLVKNKRFATAAYLVFLALNGWWTKAGKTDLISLVESVAGSDARDHAAQIRRVAAFTRDNLVTTEKFEGFLAAWKPREQGQ